MSKLDSMRKTINNKEPAKAKHKSPSKSPDLPFSVEKQTRRKKK